jgi:protein arginine N-methyltransferase 5
MGNLRTLLINVAVALSIPRLLPPLSVQSRWHSEPLRILQITKKTFEGNRRGYPSISKYHQALLTRYMRIRQPPWLLLGDVGPIPGVEAPDIPPMVGTSMIGEDSLADAEDPPPPTPAEASDIRRRPRQKSKDPTPQLSYLRDFQHRQPPRTTLERFGAGYQDYLQAPLQPLTDNLESITYEVFEKDPIKYNQYLLAIQRALQDWHDQGKPASGTDGRVVVAVVGAGRGPLVTRALEASDSTGIPIEMWALEKNPNAFVLLQRHNEETWGGRVNLVKSDMRSWKGPTRQPAPTPIHTSTYTGSWPLQTPEDPQNDPFNPAQTLPTSQPQPHTPEPQTHIPIDILISELLGSFADNELSPECLDGILPLLNPTHGLSIPTSYTAHLTPIAAPKLHADIAARAATDPAAPDTPYVVMLHAVDYLSTTSPRAPSSSTTTTTTESPSHPPSTSTSISIPQPVPNVQQAWSFTHGPMPPLPADSRNKHNERHARLHFNLRDRAVCHGLAGYFEAVLYPGVELSTNPLTMEGKSKGMMSWFPIFFPLKVRIFLLIFTPFFPLAVFACGGMADVRAYEDRHPSTPPTPLRLRCPSSASRIIGRCGMSGLWKLGRI